MASTSSDGTTRLRAAAAASPRRGRVIWVLTATCPSRCSFCDIDSQRATPPLTEEEAVQAAHDLVAAGFGEVIFVGGEPLLSPLLPPVLDALDGRVRTMVFTGGIPGEVAPWVEVLRRGGVDHLAVSLDDGDPARNDRWRGRPGITGAALALVAAVRRDLPGLDVLFNTVVTRDNVAHLEAVWQRIADHRPTAWALTLAGDNFTGAFAAHLLDREALDRLYLEQIPAFAGALAATSTDLVVLPTPVCFLEAGVPPARFGHEAKRLRDALDAELSDYARGDYNAAFSARHGCPLVGYDASIGVGGGVHPCSQAPILQDAYVLGSVREASIGAILDGAAEGFRAGVPHPPCRRCWAPSNVPPALLHRALARGMHRLPGAAS
jgi:hypothetical protein